MKNIIKFLILGTAIAPAIAMADYSVIVNQNNTNELNKDAVSRIYMLRDSRFDSGHTINVLTYGDNHVARNAFDTNVLGRDSSQMNAHWSRLSFSGRGTAPTTVSNYSEMLNQVSNNDGAIGYVPSDQVNDSVKVLFTFN